ncbi:MAG TPA: choice-of-anchor L domain-containing protein [Polyangiaceae bacterium]|jgi:hypothetical protein
MRRSSTTLASFSLVATATSLALFSQMGGCTLVTVPDDGGGTVIPPGEGGRGDDGTVADTGGGGDTSTGDDASPESSTGDGPAGDSCVCDVGNYDILGNGCDDDCNGLVDDVPSCDTGLAVQGTAGDLAKALDLCQTATGPTDPKWGVISATFSNGYQLTLPPNDNQHAVMTTFGSTVVPRLNAALGVLSSGCAGVFDDCQPGDAQQFKGTHTAMQPNQGGAVPTGFPKPASGCTTSSAVNDVIDVELKIKVPLNAKGMHFEFDFHSGEWPEFVCSSYNDSFIAYLQSQAFNGGNPDNFSFDSKNSPISVNNAFFDRCTTNSSTCGGGTVLPAPCAGGETELQGTGFFDPHSTYCGSTTESSGGATGWLASEAPVKPGEVITLDFIIWDTGDAIYDSLVLLDKFQWKDKTTGVGTGRP